MSFSTKERTRYLTTDQSQVINMTSLSILGETCHCRVPDELESSASSVPFATILFGSSSAIATTPGAHSWIFWKIKVEGGVVKCFRTESFENLQVPTVTMT